MCVFQEQMMRKKQAQHLDARYVTMVENAYYYCNPPPMEKTVRTKRPPLQEYIRKLLYKDLSKVTTEKVRHASRDPITLHPGLLGKPFKNVSIHSR